MKHLQRQRTRRGVSEGVGFQSRHSPLKCRVSLSADLREREGSIAIVRIAGCFSGVREEATGRRIELITTAMIPAAQKANKMKMK